MILKDIINMQQTLSNIVNQKLPFFLAYKFSKLAKIVDENIQFYSTSLKQIIDEYAEKDEEGNILHDENSPDMIKVKSTFVEEFQQKVEELQNVEIADEIPTFTFSDLEDKIELTTQEVLALIPVIREE